MAGCRMDGDGQCVWTAVHGSRNGRTVPELPPPPALPPLGPCSLLAPAAPWPLLPLGPCPLPHLLRLMWSLCKRHASLVWLKVSLSGAGVQEHAPERRPAELRLVRRAIRVRATFACHHGAVDLGGKEDASGRGRMDATRAAAGKHGAKQEHAWCSSQGCLIMGGSCC
eukprot:364206-Chlamydomonas_euryale.AAC.3